MADPVIIRTERLVLRPPLPQDASHIVERLGSKGVAWNLGRVPHPYQMADAEAWLEKIPQSWSEDSSYSFAITHPIDGMIGCVSLRLLPFEVWEVGYWLGEAWWGLGYTTEAAAALLHWAENERKIERCSSGHFTDNPASGAILRKLGFQPVGEASLFGLARGTDSPCIRYTKGTDPELALKLVAH